MSTENPTRTNAFRLDFAVLVASLCAVASLSLLSNKTESVPSIDCKLEMRPAQNISYQVPQVRKVSLERDPWANPILSCSLVAPKEFGYDQRHIYRLPQEPRGDWQSPQNTLRDPMANLLLQGEEEQG